MRARLLAVTHEYSASGAPVALRNALTGLTARYEIEVAGPNDGPLRAHYASAGIRAVVVPGMLEDARVCAELVAPHDLLLANTIVCYASVRAANALNKPSLWYLHEGHVGKEIMQHYPGIADAFPLASCVAYPARFAAALYANLRGARRTELICYGVAVRESLPASPRQGPLRVLQLGSIEPRKGQDIALAALRMLGRDPVQLDIVGRVLDAEFHSRLQDEFTDICNVRYSNEVAVERTPDILRACDVLIVPSRDEMTPMVILEAMALRKPVVASRICGIPEMVVDGTTGLLFDAGDATQLAAALARLVSDRALCERLGNAGRERQRRHWRLDQFRERLGDVLASLV